MFLMLAMITAGQVVELDAMKPIIGLRFVTEQNLKDQTKGGFKGPGPKGVYIAQTPGDSTPGQIAGLRFLDLLTHVNDIPVSSAEDVSAAIKDMKPGQQASFRGMRNTGTSDNLMVWGMTMSGKLTVVPSIQLAHTWTTKKTDEVEGVTWVRLASIGDSAQLAGRPSLYYKLENDKAHLLRVVFSLHSESLHLPSGLVLRAGEHKQSIPLKPFEADSSVISLKSFYSWVDRPVDEDLAKSLIAFVKNNGGIVRYEGKSSVHDEKIEAAVVSEFRMILLSFLSQGGEIPGVDSTQFKFDPVSLTEEGNSLETVEIAKPEPKPPAGKPKMEVKSKPPVDNNKVAAQKLKQAKDLIGVNDSAAKKRLKEIVEKYPDTDAAKEAAKLLEKQ